MDRSNSIFFDQAKLAVTTLALLQPGQPGLETAGEAAPEHA
jgi:hypothetical protein